jgi:hypothetical protein
VFTDIVQKFPKVWEYNRKALEGVRDIANTEYTKTTEDKVGKDWGIIHSDFWSGK